jgi:RHS repeat-associated protein
LDSNFNELIEEGESIGGGPPSTTAILDYDNNGSQINNGEFDFQWDALNRLRTVIRVSDGLQVAAYTYDCQNRRMRKLIANSGTLNGTTDYYYSNWQICEEYDFDGTNETLKYQYVWGSTYHDELIVRDFRGSGVTIQQLNDSSGSQRQFQHTNSLYSIFAVTDESGAIIERYQYDPYGNQIIFNPAFNVLPESSIGQEFSYTGQRLDFETDLYYYKNRYYSPDQGRFISRDPIGYLDGMNLYQYVIDNPINNQDSLGFVCEGYRRYFGSRFCTGEIDPYPSGAQRCCRSFISLYSNSTNVICVARCLVGYESICTRYATRSSRWNCRMQAHTRCYSFCNFVPIRGIPPGCFRIGIGIP